MLGCRELEAHPLQHAVGLRELDLVVLHDLDAVAARIAEVEPGARQDLGPCLLEREPRSNRATNWSPISRNAASGSLRSTAVGWNKSV